VEEHNFTLTELDNMMPWEREIYISLIDNKIREETENLKKQG
jgi:hypothetical protein